MDTTNLFNHMLKEGTVKRKSVLDNGGGFQYMTIPVIISGSCMVRSLDAAAGCRSQ